MVVKFDDSAIGLLSKSIKLSVHHKYVSMYSQQHCGEYYCIFLLDRIEYRTFYLIFLDNRDSFYD